MGMAHRAPMLSNLTYDVFDDAVTRFRQILAPTHRLDHQPDEAVKRVIDDGVKEAIGVGSYKKIIDHSGKQVTEALVVELPDRLGKDIFALVKPDMHGRKVAGGGLKQIVISIQDKTQVSWNMTNGNWTHEGKPGAPMSTLAAKMPKDIMNRAIDAAAKKVSEEAHKTRWRVLFEDEDGKTVGEDVIFEDKASAVSEYAKLYEEGGGQGLRLEKEILVPKWVDAPVKVRIEAD